MDTTAASRRLQELEITEVIVQASSNQVVGLPTLGDFADDGVISPQASHGYHLIEEQIIGNKVFRCLPGADHYPPNFISAAQAEILAL